MQGNAPRTGEGLALSAVLLHGDPCLRIRGIKEVVGPDAFPIALVLQASHPDDLCRIEHLVREGVIGGHLLERPLQPRQRAGLLSLVEKLQEEG